MVVPKAHKTSSGKWAVQLRLKDESGQTQSIYVLEDTEKKAVAKALEIKLSGEYKKPPEVDKQTPRALIEKYIEKRTNVLSPSTIRGYDQIKRNRFQSIMDVPVGKIKDWQRVINNEAKLCSPKTLKNAWALMVTVVGKEEMKRVKLPMVPAPDKKWLTAEQIPLFLEGMKGKACEAAAILALHGLRRSEIFALKWEDIHDGFIHIHGSVVTGPDGKQVAKKTNKTKGSTRNVPIMIDRLVELGEGKRGVVYTGNRNYLYEYINLVCERQGLPAVGVHGLRHSFASLGHGKISPIEMMKLGGWTNIQTVQNIYTHISDEEVLRAGAVMRGVFSDIAK